MMAPANWAQGNPLIQPSPQTFAELQQRQKEIEENRNGFSWYLSFANLESSNRAEQNKDSKEERK